MSTSLGQVSALLDDLRRGDAAAASRLLPIVYKGLRRLATLNMRDEKPGQTIQPTEQVHEAYLRLIGQERIEWHGRSHFFAMAASSMRRILVDRTRKKLADNHSGEGEKIQIDDALVFSLQKSKDIVALDDALDLLQEISPSNRELWNPVFCGAGDGRDREARRRVV